MKATLRVIFIFVLSILGSRNVYAQNIVKHFTIEDGLPSNEVHFVHQDDNGYYWFCTDAGISRYNGYEFTNYTTADGLTNNVVFKCFEDWNGDLWFTCIDGSITIYNQKKKAFTKYENSDWLRSKYISQRWVHHIGFREKTQEIYFFFLYNANSASVLYVDSLGRKNEQLSRIFRLSQEYEFDNLLVVRQVDTSSSSCYFQTILTDCPSLGRGRYPVILDANQHLFSRYPSFTEIRDRLFAITHLGVYEIAEDGLAMPVFEGHSATSFIQDDSKLFWVTTISRGVYVLSRHGISIIREKNLLELNEKITIGKSLKGNLVLGTNQSRLLLLDSVGGLRPFATRSIIRSNFSELHYNEDSTSLSFYGITVSAKNGKYTSCFSDVYSNVIREFKIDFEGEIRSNKFFLEEAKITLGQYLSKVQSIYTKPLVDWLIDHNKFDVFLPYMKSVLPKSCISKEHIYLASKLGLLKIYADSEKSEIVDLGPKYSALNITDLDTLNGFILLATKGHGVLVVKEDSVVTSIKVQKGSDLSIVNTVYIDKQTSVLWCGTNKGLSAFCYKIGPSAIAFELLKHVRKEDGLFSNAINDIEIINDRVYAVSDQGVTIIPKDFAAINSSPPPVVLLGYKNMDSTYFALNEHFAYNQNNIEFRYEAVINTKAKGTYQYRLLRNNDSVNWTMTDDRSITINNIASGTCVFQVRARRADSEWGVPSQYSFTIEKRFVDRMWVRALISVILLSIGYLTFTNRLRRLRKQDKLLFSNQELELQVAKLESSSLRGQMNPHLIFNVLNSIQKLILKEEKEDANKLLARFSKLVRASLQYSRFEYISLEDEVNFLNNYMNIEAQRFPGRFSYTIDVAEELLADATIPPLLIQPLCENCIKHAFVEDGGTITVRIRVENEDRLHIEVEDDGIGIYNTNTLKKSSLGTTIIRDRLKLMQKSGGIASLKIESADKNTDKGTKATLILSYN